MADRDCSFQSSNMRGTCTYQSCDRRYSYRFGYSYGGCCRNCVCNIDRSTGVGYSPDFWCSADYPCEANFTQLIDYRGVAGNHCSVNNRCNPTCRCRPGYSDLTTETGTVKCGQCNTCTCPVDPNSGLALQPRSGCTTPCPSPIDNITWDTDTSCTVSFTLTAKCRATCLCEQGYEDGPNGLCSRAITTAAATTVFSSTPASTTTPILKISCHHSKSYRTESVLMLVFGLVFFILSIINCYVHRRRSSGNADSTAA